jgi:hypothetical protein
VIFTDATGAEYRMEFASYNGTYQTVEGGLHLSMDWINGVLHFPDGSIWTMGDGTAAAEQDAGTRYPKQMKDTNGNTVTLSYAPGVGGMGTSARLTGINSPAGGYGLSYSTEALPHLTGVSGANLNDTFAITRKALVEPFGGTAFGSTSVLSSLTTWEGSTQSFTYNGSGEMTQSVSTLGGTLGWEYRTYTYTGTGRSYREVQTRTLSTGSFSGAVNNTWNMATDTAANQQ